MTALPFLIDDSEFAKSNSKVTPYEILGDCQSLLEARGRLRDADNNILENSFAKAADLANALFYNKAQEIMPVDIIRIMIALKLARIGAANHNHQEDIDSMIDLINYLAFYVAEFKNAEYKICYDRQREISCDAS